MQKIKKLIQEELDNHIFELNRKEDDGEEVYSHYRTECFDYLASDDETPISDLIKDADIESTDFNIGHEQGFMRGLEVALSHCDDDITKYLQDELNKLDLSLYDDLSDYEKGKKVILNILFNKENLTTTNNK